MRQRSREERERDLAQTYQTTLYTDARKLAPPGSFARALARWVFEADGDEHKRRMRDASGEVKARFEAEAGWSSGLSFRRLTRGDLDAVEAIEAPLKPGGPAPETPAPTAEADAAMLRRATEAAAREAGLATTEPKPKGDRPQEADDCGDVSEEALRRAIDAAAAESGLGGRG